MSHAASDRSNRRQSSTVSRRRALVETARAGLAVGAGIAVAPAIAAAQETTPVQAGGPAPHPIVGLWQFDASLDPALGPLPTFEIYHGDGTYTSWGGPDAGTTQGIWRATGERSVEVLRIATETDAFPESGPNPGTATTRVGAEVSADGATLTYGKGTFDSRDVRGVVQLTTDRMTFPPSTRVTFDNNPMTGSTVT